MPCRGTLARQASQWQPQHNELDMLRLLYLLRDVACGLKLLKSQSIVHADLVSLGQTCAGSNAVFLGSCNCQLAPAHQRGLLHYASHHRKCARGSGLW